ncbi:hypothetical protein NOMA109596_04285 [Nocardioides marinus]
MRRGLAWAVWTLLLAGVLLTTISTRYVVNDVLSANLGAWRLATTGMPWLDGFPLEAIETKPGQHLWVRESLHGHQVVFRSPGAIAAGIPAYLWSRGTAPEDFSLVPASVLAVVLTLLTLGLMARALLPHLGHAATMVAVSALALATPVWAVSADSLWPHTVTLLGIAGMAWAASRSPAGSWGTVGAFGGVALWGRLHASVVVAVLGLVVAARRRELRPAVAAGLVSGAFLAGATAWSRWVYGEWDPAGGYASVDVYASRAAEGQRWDQLANLAGLWVSPGRGLLVVTPCILLLLPALARHWRGLPDWATALLLGGLAYSVVQGLMNVFAGGTGFYGYRLMLETMACAFPALTLSAHRAGRVARALLPGLLGAQTVAVAVGAVREAYSVDPDEAWRSNALWWAVTDVPATGAALVAAALVATMAVRVLAPQWYVGGSAAQQSQQRG